MQAKKSFCNFATFVYWLFLMVSLAGYDLDIFCTILRAVAKPPPDLTYKGRQSISFLFYQPNNYLRNNSVPTLITLNSTLAVDLLNTGNEIPHPPPTQKKELSGIEKDYII